jgi:hypothetical protein
MSRKRFDLTTYALTKKMIPAKIAITPNSRARKLKAVKTIARSSCD